MTADAAHGNSTVHVNVGFQPKFFIVNAALFVLKAALFTVTVAIFHTPSADSLSKCH
jgi:hypothetical protein